MPLTKAYVRTNMLNKRFPMLKHAQMVADTARIEHYREAVMKTVRPGDVVAEDGCTSFDAPQMKFLKQTEELYQ
jgi:hypothetical protein